MPIFGTFINIDPGFASSTLTTSGIIINDLSPVWYLIIAVLLAIIIITVIVSALHKH